MNNLGKIRLVNDKDKEIQGLKCKLSNIKRKLSQALENIEDFKKQKMSGQYALFSVDEQGKYSCLCVCDPYKDDDIADEIMGKAALIMPLPNHETLKEFDGF